MSVVGVPSGWVDLIDSMVPVILELVVQTWEGMPAPQPDQREDEITIALCRALRNNRTARDLMFTIDIQVVELEPALEQDIGRLDISFRPLVPSEEIYFCLESKRLNAVSGSRPRAYASEYVTHGMMRFITGQYARAVRHGGMLAYVLDGDVPRAIRNVEANMRRKHAALRIRAADKFCPSAMLRGDPRAKETHHNRANEQRTFCIHHLFMAAALAGRKSGA